MPAPYNCFLSFPPFSSFFFYSIPFCSLFSKCPPPSIFGPLCFCLYSFLSYFSVENPLLRRLGLSSFSVALPASLPAVVSNWYFSVSAPPLPLPIFSSHLLRSVSAGRDGHQTDCQPVSVHWTHFSEESAALRFFVLQPAAVMPSLFGGIKRSSLCTRSNNCLTLQFIHRRRLIATRTVLVFTSRVRHCRILKVKVAAEVKSCTVLIEMRCFALQFRGQGPPVFVHCWFKHQIGHMASIEAPLRGGQGDMVTG